MFASGLVLVLSLAAVLGQKTENKATDEGPVPPSTVCKEYPHLNLCHIQGVLNGALEELEVLLGEDEPAEEGTQVAKRKSAFVRFGKRKSAFVRFGRSAQEDKRKSSYIRFGRK